MIVIVVGFIYPREANWVKCTFSLYSSLQSDNVIFTFINNISYLLYLCKGKYEILFKLDNTDFLMLAFFL